MSSPLILPDGTTAETPIKGPRVKQVYFNATTVLTVIGAAISLGIIRAQVETNSREIDRLRTTAELIATKDDLKQMEARVTAAQVGMQTSINELTRLLLQQHLGERR